MVTATGDKLAYTMGTLTNPDLELVKLLCLPDKVIALEIGISYSAVSMRITRIATKLGVENRTAIVVRALELGLVSIDQLVYRNLNEMT